MPFLPISFQAGDLLSRVHHLRAVNTHRCFPVFEVEHVMASESCCFCLCFLRVAIRVCPHSLCSSSIIPCVDFLWDVASHHNSGYTVAQATLQLTASPRLALNLGQSSCHSLPSTRGYRCVAPHLIFVGGFIC